MPRLLGYHHKMSHFLNLEAPLNCSVFLLDTANVFGNFPFASYMSKIPPTPKRLRTYSACGILMYFTISASFSFPAFFFFKPPLLCSFFSLYVLSCLHFRTLAQLLRNHFCYPSNQHQSSLSQMPSFRRWFIYGNQFKILVICIPKGTTLINALSRSSFFNSCEVPVLCSSIHVSVYVWVSVYVSVLLHAIKHPSSATLNHNCWTEICFLWWVFWWAKTSFFQFFPTVVCLLIV